MILLEMPDWYRGIFIYGVIPVLIILAIALGVIAIITLIKDL